MSGAAGPQAREAAPDTADMYDELEQILDELLAESLRKVKSGRVYDAENERVRIKWIRITKDVVAEKRKVIHDRTLEDLEAEIQELKAAREDAPIAVDAEV